MKRILVLATVVAVALVLSSTAFASALTCTHGSATCSGNLHGHGKLPFTGLGLGGIAGVGALLLVGGMTLNRVSRRRG